jgi:hypothetical protein
MGNRAWHSLDQASLHSLNQDPFPLLDLLLAPADSEDVPAGHWAQTLEEEPHADEVYI